MRAPLSDRGAHLGDFGISMDAALGGHPRRARIDMLGRNRWPSAGATLDLDFVNQQGYAYGQGLGRIQDLLTISGGAGGTVMSRVGQIVAATAPRFDFDPITHACKGLLIEEQRTNYNTWSDDLTTARGWGLRGTATASFVSGVEGAFTGYTDVSVAAVGISDLVKTVVSAGGGAANAIYAPSLWIKRVTTTGTLTVANIGVVGAGGQLVVDLSLLPDTWERVYIGHPAVSNTAAWMAGDGGAAGFVLRTSDGVQRQVKIRGLNLQLGPFPTSDIPTTTAAVTRTADSLTVSGATFADLYGSADGYTAYIEFRKNQPTNIAAGGLLELRQTATVAVRVGTNADGTEFSYATDGLNFREPSVFPANAGGKFAISFSPSVGDIAAAYNGVSAVTTGPLARGIVPTFFQIGRNTSNGPLKCGWLSRVLIYPRAFSSGELRALTKP